MPSVTSFLKSGVESALARAFPAYYAKKKAVRARAHSAHLESEWGLSGLTREMIERHGPCVLHGPFEGLEYPEACFDRHLASKLLGYYERELHAALETITSGSYAQVVDVGCAEGYYAVGLALAFPEAQVEAFDIDPWARARCGEMAALNGAANVTVRGACSPEWLAEHLGEGALVVSDCEGYEATLLKPKAAPQLRSADVLVELHEASAPGVTEKLKRRFERTHEIEETASKENDLVELPETRGLERSVRRAATSDLRFEEQSWLWMQPE